MTPACERPALDERPDDAQVEDDAGDAKVTGSHEAGSSDGKVECSDGDADGVCDPDDNCPGSKNADQADADGDGQGDVCDQPVQSDCSGAEVVPDSVSGAGEATFSNVRVNGATGLVSIAPGAQLMVAVDYSLAACPVGFSVLEPRTITFGLDGQGSGTCTTLLEVTCAVQANADTTFILAAPSEKGLHYIVAAGGHGISCSKSLAQAKRIAAICVQ